MAREITKTKQTGVRFDKDLLEGVISAGVAKSPQTALNIYEKSYKLYVELVAKKEGVNDEIKPSASGRKITMKERIAIEEENYLKSKK